MTFDVEGAKKAGYSDADIANHLAKQNGFDLDGARKSGYTDADVVGHLRKGSPTASSARSPATAVTAPADAGSKPGKTLSALAGLGTGVGNTALGAQYWVGRGLRRLADDPSSMVGGAADWLIRDAEQGRAKLAGELKPYADENPLSAGAGKLTGEVVATLPVGGVLAKAGGKALSFVPQSVAARFEPVLQAIGSSGFSTGRAAATTTAGKAADIGTRMVGGAVTGGTSAALVDPDSGTAGAVIGGLMPPAFKAAGITGDAFAALVRPFFASGQQKIVADVLKQYANDPQAALAALKQAREVIPGSAPLTAAASGDVGLAGLTRTLQNASGDFAGDLTQRMTAQNAARTAAMEQIGGTKAAVDLAKGARNAATDTMRESVLERAGTLDANAITAQIERMMADPKNAGATTRAGLQRALGQVREIAGETGQIDARALYEIRKDIGLAMNGKLQGDAGNLRFARGTLDKVQSVFDDAIEAASRRQVTPAQGTATGWRDYLAKYSELSKPINQMEALQDVLKRVQTGSVDTQGNLLLSAAKLNNILKTEGDDLAKLLTPEQFQQLRNLAADLNASQLAMNAGKASGSNTVQNLAGDRLLQSALGNVGGSQALQTTLGNLLRLPYSRANQSIQQRLGEALLDPQQAAKLLEQASTNPRLSQLLSPAAALAYRGVPVLPASAQ